MTYGKLITRDVKLSLSGSVAYSNALSLPIMLFLMVATGELDKLSAHGHGSFALVRSQAIRRCLWSLGPF